MKSILDRPDHQETLGASPVPRRYSLIERLPAIDGDWRVAILHRDQLCGATARTQ